MPLDRLVLILVIVIGAAAFTVWLGSIVVATVNIPYVGWAIAAPVTLVAYIFWRVLADRLNNREDDHYDQIDK